jgi:dihydroxyacetone kinase
MRQAREQPAERAGERLGQAAVSLSICMQPAVTACDSRNEEREIGLGEM